MNKMKKSKKSDEDDFKYYGNFFLNLFLEIMKDLNGYTSRYSKLATDLEKVFKNFGVKTFLEQHNTEKNPMVSKNKTKQILSVNQQRKKEKMDQFNNEKKNMFQIQ